MMTTSATPDSPHVKTQLMISATLVTTDLQRARRMYEEVMDMECVEPEKGLMYVRDKGYSPGGAKHGKPYWVLEVRERPQVEVPQEMLNHWGFEAPDQAAVDHAFERLTECKEKYGITKIQKPFFRAGAYSLYFVDKDSNWWELEYRTPDITYEALRERNVQWTETN